MRKKLTSSGSKRLFRKTSMNVQSINNAPVPVRGGFRI